MVERGAALALALAAALAAVPAAASGPAEERLQSVEQALESERGRARALESAAEALAAEAAALSRDLVDTARRLQDHEARVTKLEGRLTDLTEVEAQKRTALEARRTRLTATLGALQRISRQPPEALIATPAAIDDTIRSSVLLGAVIPLIAAEARELRAELQALTELRREIATERLELAEATAALEAERKRLAALRERKLALHRKTLEARREAQARVAGLAAEADDLRDLVERLMAAPAPPEAKPTVLAPAADDLAVEGELAVVALGQAATAANRSFADARGSLPMPARGRLVRRFGEPAGDARDRGIAIETRAFAQVVTPYDGKVVYAGPFRGYGQLLIIEHGDGYHTLLAGFSRIDAVLGQWLLAGEPVGVMGRGSNGTATLYVELRRDGEAINPLPWLAADERKVSG